MKEWMYFRLLKGKVITDPDICPFFVDNWEDRGRVDKAKDFWWRWGIEQETRTGDYSRNPSNCDGQLKHRQLESVWGKGTLGGGDSRSLPLQNWFLMSFSVCSHVVYKGCAMLYGNQYIGQWEQEYSERLTPSNILA